MLVVREEGVLLVRVRRLLAGLRGLREVVDIILEGVVQELFRGELLL